VRSQGLVCLCGRSEAPFVGVKGDDEVNYAGGGKNLGLRFGEGGSARSCSGHPGHRSIDCQHVKGSFDKDQSTVDEGMGPL
jgi:hypothetical protein